MGENVSSSWALQPFRGFNQSKSGAVAGAGAGAGTSVTLGQVWSHLKETLQISAQKFEEIIHKVQSRAAANVTLTLKIIEASDLRAKTVKGASNPFVTITVNGNFETHRTSVQHETLSPKWREEFKIAVKNLNKDILKLEVWHDLDPSVTHQVLAVKDLKGLSRLVKSTTAIAHHESVQLLGTVTVPLKEIRENGLNEWFPLTKESPKEGEKPRGLLHIEAYITAASNATITPLEARISHDALLCNLIYHHAKTDTNKNTGEKSQAPWHGQLSPEASAAIAQHAIIVGLAPSQQALSWWIVGSKATFADAEWQLKKLMAVQKHLAEGAYDSTEMEQLAESFSAWVEYALEKLRDLHENFDPSSGVIAKHEFSNTLTTLAQLESDEESKSLLESKEVNCVRSLARDAATEYVISWWSGLIERNLKDQMNPEGQIQKLVLITNEIYDFLCEVAHFYGPALLKEMNIPYFRETYILVTNKLNPCIKPPLMNIYSHLDDITKALTNESSKKNVTKSSSNGSSKNDVTKASTNGSSKNDVTITSSNGSNIEENAPTYTLEDGTNLWQLYVSLGKIHKLGCDLPLAVRTESGIFEYHKWFNQAVHKWFELARHNALRMIEKAVKLDDLEPVDEYCNFSSSATDLSGIFTDVQIWWRKLEWPDPENSIILLSKIIEDVCSYGMKYADLLKIKVEDMFTLEGNADHFGIGISKQICIGLNNIERVREELTTLPETFGAKSLLERVKHSETEGENIAATFETNFSNLIAKSSENMKSKVNEFIDDLVKKMNSTLHHSVVQACEIASEEPLLGKVLDPELQLLLENMSDTNFKRFLRRLWEVVLAAFQLTVNQNSEKRKPSYFSGVYKILQSSFLFFSPSEGTGLTREEAETPEYLALLELLECLRLPSEKVIVKYYTERLKEQNLSETLSKGQLVVRTLFTKAGKLNVEVIMAKDMQLPKENKENGSVAPAVTQDKVPHQSIDAYVKVQLIPEEWFPNRGEFKTKILKKSDPAVFEESFSFELRNDDTGVSSGFLLFTVKDYNIGRPNTFIGEAIVPLWELKCVDFADSQLVHNAYVKLTRPRLQHGYQALRALRVRTGDRIALNFLKKLHSKIPEHLLPGDETKHWSPPLLRKLKKN